MMNLLKSISNLATGKYGLAKTFWYGYFTTKTIVNFLALFTFVGMILYRIPSGYSELIITFCMLSILISALAGSGMVAIMNRCGVTGWGIVGLVWVLLALLVTILILSSVWGKSFTMPSEGFDIFYSQLNKDLNNI